MKETWYFVTILLVLGVFASFASMTPTGAFIVNLPPSWDYPASEFSVDDSLNLKLDDAFFDPDGDSLSYSVSASPGVNAGIYDGVLVVFGEGQVTVTATDGHTVVSKVLKVY